MTGTISLPKYSLPKWILTSGVIWGLFVPGMAMAAPANIYLQHNLVANVAGQADVTDANLVDPWGISLSSTSPFWVSNHLSGTSTLYSGNGAITAVVVTIPPGKASTPPGRPTGQVQNGSNGFILQNGTKASFIFATEDGTISAWNTGTVAQVLADNSSAGAVYKGLAINPSLTAPLIYAANFNSGKIDVFDGSFAPTTATGGFTDPNLPAGFAPFNIWNLNNQLYVTYAKQDSNKLLDVAGAGNGFVDVFDFNGTLLKRLVSNGVLNSPWGVAIAPAGWGAFGGALLVGNFGNGQINAFDITTGNPLGTLQDATGAAISLPGLWAIVFGGNGSRSDANTLYFAAGVANGSTTKRGLLGSLAPPSAISFMYNAAGGQSAAIAPGEIVSIGGQTVGPAPSVAATLAATGTVASALATTTVTFNNLPAPVIYTSGSLSSVVVPYGVAGSTSASVVLKTGGQTTAAFTIPVVGSVPGVFTSNDSGLGQAVVFNQDGTINTTANAAAKGSVVILYATGEGMTNPAGQDGLISSNDILREPLLPVSLTIGGATAQVLYAGSAPGNVAGVMEVEAVVPAGATSGAAPVVLSVGTAASQANVTLNVK
jgi:uncharacterized protein (TIGR03118 family)